MSVLSVLGKIRSLLGKLTDILIKGRQAGLWSEDGKILTDKKEK